MIETEKRFKKEKEQNDGYSKDKHYQSKDQSKKREERKGYPELTVVALILNENGEIFLMRSRK